MNTKSLKTILTSFIERKSSTYTYGLDIMKELVIIENHKLIVNSNSEVLFNMKVKNEFCNVIGTMHGGAIATLIDVSTTIAVTALDKTNRTNVSVSLSTEFLNPALNNSRIFIHCKIPKIGKSLAYTYVDILSETDLKLIARGSHIKAMIEPKEKIQKL